MGFQGMFTYFAPEAMMQVAMDMIVKVFKPEGDHLEFGIYEGRGFTPMYHFARSRNLSAMKFYAFDSFEGLLEIEGER